MNKITRYLGLHLTTIASVITLSLWMSPGIAGDFFRERNHRQIGRYTEAAFTAIFAEGNYPEGKKQLELAQQKEPNEPLVYTLLAGFAYLDEDDKTATKYSKKILQAADRLANEDPLRSRIYTSIGHLVANSGSLKGRISLSTLSQLQLVLDRIDEAEKISPRDPELNLVKGLIDLFLSINLPFSDPDAAIARLDKYAAPRYVADRTIAIGYRDLKRYSKALRYVDKAIAEAPNNPELYYLKAQIQVSLGKQKKNTQYFSEANQNYDLALQKSSQLPKTIVADIAGEKCENQARLEDRSLNCQNLKASIKQESGLWGPSKLPNLN